MTKISNTSKLSIVIPVYQEAQNIIALLRHLRELEHEREFEIIVVDGDQAETTIKAIEDEDVITMVSETGRANQMNAGAAVAKGDILLFLHADTTLPANALKLIPEILMDNEYVAGAFELAINSKKTIYRLISKATSLRSHLTRTPYGDQAIFIKKDYFDRIGGYQNIPIMEDVELMKRIKKRGEGIYIVKQPVKTSPRKWEAEGVASRTIKNQLIKIGYMLGISPERLVKLYDKRKEKS